MQTNLTKSLKRGFTLLELLIVIAIIGILAGTVFISLDASREKSRRSSALASLRSAMPVLLTCTDSGGYGYVDDASVAGKYVCQNAATGNNAKAGFSAVWSTLSTSGGWVYAQPTGTLSANNYQYTATKAGKVTIVCSTATARCI